MQQTIDEAALVRFRAAAAQLGITLSAPQLRQMHDYIALLERWNAVHNLTALRDKDELLASLVFDSLTLAAALVRHSEGRQLRVLDVGSGSGFPAAVIAVVRPTWAVHAIDSVSKKTAFIQQAAVESRIANLHSLSGRVEKLPAALQFDAVVSKAFGSLRALVVSTDRLLEPGGIWVAQKGKYPASELAELPTEVEAFHVEPVTVPELDEERCLVWLRRSESR